MPRVDSSLLWSCLHCLGPENAVSGDSSMCPDCAMLSWLLSLPLNFVKTFIVFLLIIWFPVHPVRQMKRIWPSPFTYEKAETQKDYTNHLSLVSETSYLGFWFFFISIMFCCNFWLIICFLGKMVSSFYVLIFSYCVKEMLENKQCSFEKFWRP